MMKIIEFPYKGSYSSGHTENYIKEHIQYAKNIVTDKEYAEKDGKTYVTKYLVLEIKRGYNEYNTHILIKYDDGYVFGNYIFQPLGAGEGVFVSVTGEPIKFFNR